MSLRVLQKNFDAHRKNPGSCSIKGDTVHGREMPQDPPVHLHVLIIADRVDRAEALSSCELSASAHLHYNHNHSTFHFSACQDRSLNAFNRDQGWLGARGRGKSCCGKFTILDQHSWMQLKHHPSNPQVLTSPSDNSSSHNDINTTHF